MRTTIDLPEEVLQRAQVQAAQQGVDVNQFIAAAIAKEVNGGVGRKSASSQQRSKLPTIQGRGTGTIPDLTPELQAQLQEEEDLASYNRSLGR
jgi:hypothetical protein